MHAEYAPGVTSAKRSPRLPEVPTISETVPGFELMVWYGVCAPAGVSKAIVNKVAADVQQALKTPDVQKKMESLGVDVEFMGPEKFGAYIKSETAKWTKVVKEAGLEER